MVWTLGRGLGLIPQAVCLIESRAPRFPFPDSVPSLRGIAALTGMVTAIVNHGAVAGGTDGS